MSEYDKNWLSKIPNNIYEKGIYALNNWSSKDIWRKGILVEEYAIEQARQENLSISEWAQSIVDLSSYAGLSIQYSGFDLSLSELDINFIEAVSLLTLIEGYRGQSDSAESLISILHEIALAENEDLERRYKASLGDEFIEQHEKRGARKRSTPGGLASKGARGVKGHLQELARFIRIDPSEHNANELIGAFENEYENQMPTIEREFPNKFIVIESERVLLLENGRQKGRDVSLNNFKAYLKQIF